MTNQELFDLLYVQTQEIATKEGAAEYAALPKQDRKRLSRKREVYFSRNAKWWVDLFQDWAKGRVGEETIRGHILNHKTNRFYYPA
jgi:hypothetical protein